jgi:hypothetical protein
MPTITTKLLRGATDVSGTTPIVVDDAGTTIDLVVQPGLELVDAALTVQVPDDAAPIDLLEGTAATTSAGAADIKKPSAWGAVAWVVLDWRVRRGLVRLEVAISKPAAAPVVPGAPAPPPPMLRLRASDSGGPWVLTTPVALVSLVDTGSTLSASVQLPGLSASRLMIEVVTRPTKDPLGPEDYVPAPATFTRMSLTGSPRPPALTISVPPETIVCHEPGLLPPGATLSVRESLLAALRWALPGTTGGRAQILVRSPGAAALQRVILTLGSRPELTRWRGARPELDLPVGTEREAIGFIDPGAHPTSFAARVEVELRPERPPVVATPPATGYAHRCTPDSALAQSFCFAHTVDLVGLDLMLAPCTRVAQGRVTLHADAHGAPGEPPLAALALDLADLDPHAPATWRSLDLPRPLPLAAGASVWVALTLTTGELGWALATRPEATPVRALLRRDRGESWVPRDMTFQAGPARPWALARPRLRRDGPPPALDLRLRRGSQELLLTPDTAGRVAVDADALAPLLTVAATTPLELVVRSSSAGRVRLRELRVTLPIQSNTWTFPLPR